MIISASRRTDIPAFFSEWLLNRIKEGHVWTRNPMNHNQIRKVDLDPGAVDCIVFWSKNPQPMLDKLGAFRDYTYYFQFTLNPYGEDIEPNLPDKKLIIETFKQLSGRTSPKKIIWRYDPVLINKKYTVQYHIEKFNSLALELGGYTEKVIFSFMDFYKKTSGKIKQNDIKSITDEEKKIIAAGFARAAGENKLAVYACAEGAPPHAEGGDLSLYGIAPARCVDDRLISEITGRDFQVKKDKNQRPECNCAVSVDVGAYNTCPNACIYCYANYSQGTVAANMIKHDKLSPVLIGSV